jgi:hypothetical protein
MLEIIQYRAKNPDFTRRGYRETKYSTVNLAPSGHRTIYSLRNERFARHRRMDYLSEMFLGNDLDLDKLNKVLENNHDIAANFALRLGLPLEQEMISGGRIIPLYGGESKRALQFNFVMKNHENNALCVLSISRIKGIEMRIKGEIGLKKVVVSRDFQPQIMWAIERLHQELTSCNIYHPPGGLA